VLSACFGAGALAGALLSASVGRADWRVVIASGAGIGIGELILAPQRTLAAAIVLLVVTGACFSLFTSNCNSTIQLDTPDHLRGRVLSLYSYVFFGTAPLGGFLAGWFAERGGTVLAFGVGGGTALVAAAIGASVLHHRRRAGPAVAAMAAAPR
jgi:MFS family permease